MFDYIYRYNHRDLRNTIVALHNIWTRFQYKRSIPRFAHTFDALRYIRSFDDNQIDASNIQKYEWDLINNYFEQSPHNKNPSARSSIIEKGLEHAWKCLQHEPLSPITYVKNNPTIKANIAFDNEKR